MKPLSVLQQKYLTSHLPGRLKYLHTAKRLGQSIPVLLWRMFLLLLLYCHGAPVLVVLMHFNGSLQSAVRLNLGEFWSCVEAHLNALPQSQWKAKAVKCRFPPLSPADRGNLGKNEKIEAIGIFSVYLEGMEDMNKGKCSNSSEAIEA